jgi:hypothetical protein
LHTTQDAASWAVSVMWPTCDGRAAPNVIFDCPLRIAEGGQVFRDTEGHVEIVDGLSALPNGPDTTVEFSLANPAAHETVTCKRGHGALSIEVERLQTSTALFVRQREVEDARTRGHEDDDGGRLVVGRAKRLAITNKSRYQHVRPRAQRKAQDIGHRRCGYLQPKHKTQYDDITPTGWQECKQQKLLSCATALQRYSITENNNFERGDSGHSMLRSRSPFSFSLMCSEFCSVST